MTDLSYATASELAPLIRSGEVSPVELTQHCLDRIEQQDGIILAFITVTPDIALEQACRAEQEIRDGRWRGPLHGMPVGIKDTYQTEGVLSTSGSALFGDFVPDRSSTVVAKLIDDAGAVMVGKLNMHSLGPGSAGFNPTYGHTRNPWNADHIVGGSSGGSAAALAAGMVPVVTGTDMWGSLRVPAAMCGVYGLKPTNGRSSSTGNIPTSETLDQTGPMARSVPDLVMLLQAIAGHDPEDPTSVGVGVPDCIKHLERGVRGVRIGIPSYYRRGVDPEILRMFDESAQKLRGLGAEVVDLEIPELEMATFGGLATALSESGANYLQSLRQTPEQHTQDVRALLMAGPIISGAQYTIAQKTRRALGAAMRRAFDDVDLLLAPTVKIRTPAFAPDWEVQWVDQAFDVIEGALPFTAPANMTGAPAVSVPMGLDSAGLPAGMQFIGPNFSEPRLLQAARAWEGTEPLSYEALSSREG